MFAQYYRQYEPSIDVAPLPSGDLIVDNKELAALAEDWLIEKPPGQASSPNPPDGAACSTLTPDLTWTAAPFVTSHDVYFGTNSSPPFVGNQSSTTFQPGKLEYGTLYYWRIDERNKWGMTTGQLWSFITLLQPPF